MPWPRCFPLVLLLALALYPSDRDAIHAGAPTVSPTSSLPLGLSADGDAPQPAALVNLGSFLFSSPLLSRDRTVSCASCHVPGLAFSGPAPTAIGIGGTAGRRHPPPLLNLYAAPTLMLDGRVSSLEDQALLPLESQAEMDVDWPASLQAFNAEEGLRRYLAGLDEPLLTKPLAVKALSAYVRSLVAGDSPFDRYYYRGEEAALGPQAREGLALFVRKGRCAGCHLVTGYTAPLTDGAFHSVGIGFENGRYRDSGRGAVTGAPADLGAFKTPTLRNVAQRRHFMHDGSLHSLRDVVAYYDRGGTPGAPNQDGRIQPLHLTEEEVEALVAFLGSLTGEIQSYRQDGPAAK